MTGRTEDAGWGWGDGGGYREGGDGYAVGFGMNVGKLLPMTESGKISLLRFSPELWRSWRLLLMLLPATATVYNIHTYNNIVPGIYGYSCDACRPNQKHWITAVLYLWSTPKTIIIDLWPTIGFIADSSYQKLTTHTHTLSLHVAGSRYTKSRI